MDFGDKCSSCCCSVSIGILQLALTVALLIGWCWSIAWGNYYVEMSGTIWQHCIKRSFQYLEGQGDSICCVTENCIHGIKYQEGLDSSGLYIHFENGKRWHVYIQASNLCIITKLTMYLNKTPSYLW